MRKQIFQTLSLKMISIGQHKSDDLEIFLYPRDQKARGQPGRVFTVSEQAPYEGEKGEQSVCGVFPSRPLSYVYFRPPACLFLSFTYKPMRGACSQAKISTLAEILYTN